MKAISGARRINRKLLLRKNKSQKLDQDTKGTGASLGAFESYLKDGYANCFRGTQQRNMIMTSVNHRKRQEQNRDITYG